MTTRPRKTDYTNRAQQRLLQVVLALFADVVQGMAPTALAKAVVCSVPVILRDLDNLATAGLAERDEATGLWRLTQRLPQQSIKVFAALDTAQRRLDEARQRYTRNPG